MTKPSYGWGHKELETLLGTPTLNTTSSVIITMVISVTATQTATIVVPITGKQKGQVIGAVIGGIIALAFIGGVIYFIRMHKKKGKKRETGTTPASGSRVELDASDQRAELDVNNMRTELDVNSLDTSSSGGNVGEPAVDESRLSGIITPVLAPPQGVGTPASRTAEFPISRTSEKYLG